MSKSAPYHQHAHPSQEWRGYTLTDYQHGFTQPTPAYGLKDENGWRTVPRSLTKGVLERHLAHEISVGTYGRWYPRFGIIDIDDVAPSQLAEIRSRLGMHTKNSLAFTSESKDSYHIYFKPMRKGKMLNLNLYLKCMAMAREVLNIEVYPQANRFIRLPFGRGQKLFEGGISCEIEYTLGLDLLHNLEEYDVDQLPYLPNLADELYPSFQAPRFNNTALNKGWKEAGLQLLEHGLERIGTRLESLQRIIYYFWSQNMPLETTVAKTQEWIQTKHNGFSKDYQHHPQRVLSQIVELATWTYQNFDHHYTLPDSAHIVDKGYLTAELLPHIVRASQGRLPILKFGIELFAYLAPRNVGGNKIAVHRDRLVEWSSTKNYLTYIDHFKAAGLLKRDARYSAGAYAKGISLLTGHTPYEQALLWDEARPLSGVHQVIPAVYTPQEYSLQLKAMGVERSHIRKHINEIWQEEADTKQAPVRTKKASTQERIKEYLKEHPNASSRTIAKALNMGKSQIANLMKNL